MTIALTGIKNFLQLVNDNWTLIIIIAGLIVTLYRKAKSYLSLTNEEKIEIAKKQVSEIILKKISDAEEEYEKWVEAGSVKRAKVMEEIFKQYPILSKVTNQEELIKWIDIQIDNALVELRKIIEKNKALESEMIQEEEQITEAASTETVSK